MRYQIEAMNPTGGIVTDVIDADSRGRVSQELRERGLMMLKCVEAAGPPRTTVTFTVRHKVTDGDLVLFARQMKMLLTSGAALVPALEAAESQTERPLVRRMVASLREHVEGGQTLTDAMAAQAEIFRPVHRSMIAAGEATARLPEAFGRLADLTQRQLQLRRALVGALVYPAVLSVLCTGVIAVLIGFVVPRFRKLFLNLNSDLPASTELMFAAAMAVRSGWPLLLAAVVLAVAGLVVGLRLPQVRRRLAQISLHLPLVGGLIAKVELAKMLRVWAAMLRSNVPLLETLEQSRAAVRNPVFVDLLTQLEDNVSSGGRIGQTLAQCPHVERIVASAITTGEENGKLGEAVEFVSGWIDDETTQAISSLTRIAEPVLLAVMGLVVGLVALSLFLPLFDIATAGA